MLQFIKKLKKTLIFVSVFASTTVLAEQSAREFFEFSYKKLIAPPELKHNQASKISTRIIKTLAAQSRFRAKLIRIDENSIEVKNNNLYFKLNNGICLQEAVELENSFLLRTLCLRENYVLMDFTFKYLKN